MREILFRGKLCDSEEWVYGSFCMDALEQFNGLCGVDGFIRLYDKAKGKMQMYEVDRETVGQFTGLTDCAGNKLFEHDIVTAKFNSNGARYNFKIVFSVGEFLFDNGSVAVRFDKIRSAVKIGNIHDNQEGGKQ